MRPMLTLTQTASWHNVSERTISRMVKLGKIQQPVIAGNRPQFPADVVLPQILRDGDVKFAGSVTLITIDGPIVFEVISPKYRLEKFDRQWAIFEDLHGLLHLRSWGTDFVFLPDSLDHCPIILNCEDSAVENFRLEDLHLEIWTAPDWSFERLTSEGFYEQPNIARSDYVIVAQSGDLSAIN